MITPTKSKNAYNTNLVPRWRELALAVNRLEENFSRYRANTANYQQLEKIVSEIKSELQKLQERCDNLEQQTENLQSENKNLTKLLDKYKDQNEKGNRALVEPTK